jgi:hypothetical protein
VIVVKRSAIVGLETTITNKLKVTLAGIEIAPVIRTLFPLLNDTSSLATIAGQEQ